jgi:drug/metabolite transporter (DMT)-like permease
MLHAFSFLAGERIAAVAWTPTALAALGYVSVFAGVVAYIAYFGLLDDIGAIRASLTFYVTPIVATLGGWALLGEGISATTVVGFGVILVGFAIVGSEELSGGFPVSLSSFAARNALRRDGAPHSPSRTVTTSERAGYQDSD